MSWFSDLTPNHSYFQVPGTFNEVGNDNYGGYYIGYDN